jgi:hypothetical protein
MIADTCTEKSRLTHVISDLTLELHAFRHEFRKGNADFKRELIYWIGGVGALQITALVWLLWHFN